MPVELRTGAVLGRRVRDADGNDLGRIADLVTEPGADGRERIVAALVVRGPWGRLLGYERDEVVGPWLLERVARLISRRETRRIPWDQLKV